MSGEKPAVEFVSAFFVELVNTGDKFQPGELPLHITTFPPILRRYEFEFGKEVRGAVGSMEPFTVTVGESDLFGPDRRTRVKRIEDSNELQHLHDKLVVAVGHLLHDPTYRQPYSPHISVSNYKDIPTGKQIEIAGFSIIGKIDTGLWEVVDKIGLKGAPHETIS